MYSDRLLLRPLSISDKESIFSYRSNAEVNKYQRWIPTSLDEVEDFIFKLPILPNQPDSWYQMGICEKDFSEKVIGDIGIHFMADNQQVEIGCTLGKDYHGKGYATEALKRILEYLFNDLEKHRITASIDPKNEKSIRLFNRLGFRLEAHFIESLYLNDKWVDDMIFAMLKREWN